jgi:hypothetical protein
MRKGRTLAGIAAALLVLVAAGWWFGSPWWTLWRMREAAEARDAETLAAYIDFPALRASTREQLGLGPLGALVAGPAIDAAISPEALSLALGRGRGAPGASGGGTGAPDGGASEPAKVDLSRAGASEFRVGGERSDLVFRRHGLGWKLEEIRLSSPR